MQRFLTFCFLLTIASAAPSNLDFTCFRHDEDNKTICHLENLHLTSEANANFPVEPKIHLHNSTIDFLAPEVTSRLADSTVELSILDGAAPRLYLKRTLRHFASLRSGTIEVIIDPEDNPNLEVLDVAGELPAIPANVKHLRQLAVLDLCENAIERVDLGAELDGLVRLRKINLGRNKIASVALGGELNLPELEELFLHGNLLTELDLGGLKADNLKRFYVSQNQLVRIDGFSREKFPRLVRTDLYLNKWECGWLEETEGKLAASGVETLSYLPERACDESGTVKVEKLECEQEEKE